MVSAYELERQRNILENQRLLDSLQVVPTNSKPAPEARRRPTKRNREPRSSSIKPSRKSRRIATRASVTGIQTEESSESDSTSKPATIALRKLTSVAPSIPRVKGPYLRAELPTRREDGLLVFEEPYSDFAPNLTPSEVLELGSFGGTFFRPFYSRILGQHISPDYNEFPDGWFHPKVRPDRLLTKPDNLNREDYHPSLNFYGVKAGQSLEEWERSGWIRPQDPRGWFQWYCRFYLGRRSEDDERQISRWLGVCGPTGRFKRSLVKKIAQSRKHWDDHTVSPVIRQTLQHWAYRLTGQDYELYTT